MNDEPTMLELSEADIQVMTELIPRLLNFSVTFCPLNVLNPTAISGSEQISAAESDAKFFLIFPNII